MTALRAGRNRAFTGDDYRTGGHGAGIVIYVVSFGALPPLNPLRLYVMNKILLQCDNLCKRYQEGSVQTDVLHNVSFSIEEGR